MYRLALTPNAFFLTQQISPPRCDSCPAPTVIFNNSSVNCLIVFKCHRCGENFPLQEEHYGLLVWFIQQVMADPACFVSSEQEVAVQRASGVRSYLPPGFIQSDCPHCKQITQKDYFSTEIYAIFICNMGRTHLPGYEVRKLVATHESSAQGLTDLDELFGGLALGGSSGGAAAAASATPPNLFSSVDMSTIGLGLARAEANPLLLASASSGFGPTRVDKLSGRSKDAPYSNRGATSERQRTQNPHKLLCRLCSAEFFERRKLAEHMQKNHGVLLGNTL